MRTTILTTLILAAAVAAGVPAHAADPAPAPNLDKSQLAPDAQGLVATDAAFAYVRGRSAASSKTISEKIVACHGVSRARFAATLDESMVTCYSQIAPKYKPRMSINDAMPAFALCARTTMLRTLNLDADTVNPCIAAAQ
ncbi:hypothetical protein [Massilia sp. CCM 8734]|uniref:hypothetical protein n=1 Tax=Massilia sp. CCM 8734 TaxID=2609283 RepID=UPI00141F334F|nr:hypothetical protein [Massilia sp. CCM 8734]NHZ96070.1 hypothetical protein [Massilia sp. CCM 8734]